MGIRPTYVGIPRQGPPGLRLGADPPHVCGDHPTPPMNAASSTTSAPRMWGSPVHAGLLVVQDVIRPTYVGITPPSNGF